MMADSRAHMGVPAAYRAKLHSTNPIERLNGEINTAPRSSGYFRMSKPSPASSAPS